MNGGRDPGVQFKPKLKQLKVHTSIIRNEFPQIHVLTQKSAGNAPVATCLCDAALTTDQSSARVLWRSHLYNMQIFDGAFPWHISNTLFSGREQSQSNGSSPKTKAKKIPNPKAARETFPTRSSACNCHQRERLSPSFPRPRRRSSAVVRWFNELK